MIKEIARCILRAALPLVYKKISYKRNKRLVDGITKKYLTAMGTVVLSGPFQGLKYIDAAKGSSLMPKIIGCYESELHKAIERMIAEKPDVVINIGCAEGYYAVGIAMRLADVRVIAYDIDADAQLLCGKLARMNGVDKKVDIKGECAPETLQCAISGKCLIICDCEGYEDKLLDPEIVSGLKDCDIMAEAHEFIVPGVTGRLKKRFEITHKITEIFSEDRKPDEYPDLSFLNDFEKSIALSEGRPAGMSWLMMEAK